MRGQDSVVLLGGNWGAEPVSLRQFRIRQDRRCVAVGGAAIVSAYAFVRNSANWLRIAWVRKLTKPIALDI